MKLCKDCKHVSRDWGNEFVGNKEYSTCRVTATINIVSGREHEVLCERERGGYGNCGPEGKLWEPKRKWWGLKR